MRNVDIQQWNEELARGVDNNGISPEKAADILKVGALEVMRLMENNELDHVHVFKDPNLTDELFVVIPNYSLKRYLEDHPIQKEETPERKEDLLFDEENLMVSKIAAGAESISSPALSGNRALGDQSLVITQLENAMMEREPGLRKDDMILSRNPTQGNQADYMITNIDPITGKDIPNVEGHPFIQDGNVTIYFESEETKKAYLDMPLTDTHNLADSNIEGLNES